jgi:predicted  nucleic acid-binding Zn-ribbon protein
MLGLILNHIAETEFDTCPQCGLIIKRYVEKTGERKKRDAELEKERQSKILEDKKRAEDEARYNASKAAFVKNIEASKPISDKTASGAVVGGGIGAVTGLLSVCAGFGIFFFIPVIGWIVGPIIMLMGVCMPFLGAGTGAVAANQSYIKGTCPHCGGPISAQVKKQIYGIDCNVCRKRVVIKGNQFTRID